MTTPEDTLPLLLQNLNISQRCITHTSKFVLGIENAFNYADNLTLIIQELETIIKLLLQTKHSLFWESEHISKQQRKLVAIFYLLNHLVVKADSRKRAGLKTVVDARLEHVCRAMRGLYLEEQWGRSIFQTVYLWRKSRNFAQANLGRCLRDLEVMRGNTSSLGMFNQGDFQVGVLVEYAEARGALKAKQRESGKGNRGNGGNQGNHGKGLARGVKRDRRASITAVSPQKEYAKGESTPKPNPAVLYNSSRMSKHDSDNSVKYSDLHTLDGGNLKQINKVDSTGSSNLDFQGLEGKTKSYLKDGADPLTHKKNTGKREVIRGLKSFSFESKTETFAQELVEAKKEAILATKKMLQEIESSLCKNILEIQEIDDFLDKIQGRLVSKH